jgi:23S rRNA (cytidine1920-2'-O)/16S rRNA (cytidine1409-2'-O)-methyltransferase
VLTVLLLDQELEVVRTRLDKLLVERGITPSRERAQALILAGKVLVDEQKIEKAGAAVDSQSSLRLLGDDLRYVSRGGLKLEKALEHWQIDLSKKVCLDVGASTGGFSDCMLQHGAARVIAIDTGYGQMDFRLRNDPRVRLLEKTNARYLQANDIGEPGDFIAMDVSFISATVVLPAVIRAAWSGLATNVACHPERSEGPAARGEKQVLRFAQDDKFRGDKLANDKLADSKLAGEKLTDDLLTDELTDDLLTGDKLAGDRLAERDCEIVVLVKPQFEAGREAVGKGGIVRDEATQLAAVAKVETALKDLGFAGTEWIESPILGGEGNREFLLHAKFAAPSLE